MASNMYGLPDQMSAASVEDEYQEIGPTIDDIVSATIGEAEDDLDRSSSDSSLALGQNYTLETLPQEVYEVLQPCYRTTSNFNQDH